MASMVQVEHTAPLNMEQMVTNLMRKPCRGMVRVVLMDKESVFRFQAENTIQHVTTRGLPSGQPARADRVHPM